MEHLASLLVAARKAAGVISRRRVRTVALFIAMVEGAATLLAAHPAAAGYTLNPRVQATSPGLTMPDETTTYLERLALGIQVYWGTCDVHTVSVRCPEVGGLPPVQLNAAYEETGPATVNCPSAATATPTATCTPTCHASPSPAHCNGNDPAAQGCGSGAQVNEEQSDSFSFYVDNRWSASCQVNWTRVFYTNNYWRKLHAEANYVGYANYQGTVGFDDYYEPNQNAGNGPMMWGRMMWGGSGAPQVCSEGDGTVYTQAADGTWGWSTADQPLTTSCY
jgi:hypothetical protein